jgi:preprotein translocase subunit SecD
VQQAITGGQTTITGLTAEEVKTLAILLNAGALPLPVEVIREEAVP